MTSASTVVRLTPGEGKVPFYVTSNAYIADASADATVTFFLDTCPGEHGTGRRPPLTADVRPG
jgi:Flp pilus assembly protein TadG